MNTEIEPLITYYAQGCMSGWVSSFTYAHGARPSQSATLEIFVFHWPRDKHYTTWFSSESSCSLFVKSNYEEVSDT